MSSHGHHGAVDRREFLASTAGMALGLAVTASSNAPAVAAPATAPATTRAAVDDGPVIDSPPVVQNPSTTGFSVAFAVRRLAAGWVEYGPTPELGLRAAGSRYGLGPCWERIVSARVDGLEAGKSVYYRVAAAPVTYRSAYKIERGNVEVGPTYRLDLPNPSAQRASFAVINDTHENATTLAGLFGRLADKDKSDLLVWNGDVFNDIRTEEQIAQQVLRPALATAYAAQQPVLFTSGNHDVRGVAARMLPRAILPWSGEEPLGRCFTVRHGPMALVGLDTGEDKPDKHPVFAGLADFEPYRRAQAAWLEQALARPMVASAPFIVVCCHIPLWGLPGENGGDTLQGYADYMKQSQSLWNPILAKARISLLICGHTHEDRFDAPTAEHPYPQLVGGGPKGPQATLIRGSATAEELEVVMTRLDGSARGRWTMKPR